MCYEINASLMAYYLLFKKDYAEIQQNEPAESCLRKKFACVARTQAETDDKITSLLTHWKKDKQSATDSHFSQMTIDPLITQEADKIRLAMKIIATIGDFLVIAIIATAILAGAIYATALLCQLLILLLHGTVPFGGAPPVFVIPSTVTTLLITSGCCAGSRILSSLAWCILDRSSAIRADRIQNDKNFQEFVENYLEKKCGFFATHEQLADQGLHSIYSQWKYRMRKMSAIVAGLHSKMQLKNALEQTKLQLAT